MKKQPPLAGIRIADMSTVVFGPYCTQILADLGADVIKVEPPGGDTVRRIGTPPVTVGMGPVHMRLNRGKRSVDWDQKTEAGRAAMRRLLETADVFVHNIRPEAIERAGLGYDEVRKLRPDIIYVHCTGFGLDGPYAGLQAYDDIIQAASGAATLLPRVDGDPKPRYLPTLFADKVSGLHAAYATLAAVVQRLRTGEGQYIEVPMFESIASFNLLEHLCNETYVPPTGRWGYSRQLDPTRQPMRTRDGYISVAPYIDDRWVRFFEAAGHGEVLDEPRFADEMSRRNSVQQMYEVMAIILPERTTAEWLSILKAANVPAIQVNEISSVLTDPHLNATGLFRQRVHPTEGGYIEVRPPVRFAGFDYPDLCDAPAPGQHTDELNRELGIAGDDGVN
ncbi:carnitine dehydratase [Burkholderia sp. MSh2]|uniref:Acetyl-CoA acetyltransferase n=1 Tax=Burkholderia paludis TaxID=1506587 RepID=A0A6J5F3B5_9BURK|nr:MULTISPECIES: CoA transferase [Burkholderia]KEZ00757.1 carnitine dehydratase [Burkholderia sp. MSh2]CAB3773330.1 putative fatty acyl-CoA transferase [Burkholderia paludis]VWC44972.1 acetyl-CoA acetyltransferase [Burkholderia paludis]